MSFPPSPETPPSDRAVGDYPLRFEDLAQDGRVHFDPVVASIDAAVWRPLLNKSPMSRALFEAGVRPIFTRLVLDVGPGRLQLGSLLSAEGTYQLAHEPDGAGGVARLFLNMWTRVWAGPDKRLPERVEVGRLFAEHQLTRPHAPPGERRVTSLPLGAPTPGAIYRAPEASSLLELAPGEAWLEPAATPDPARVVFGLSHTDVNQHVNSLVYPRLFEEAALRRFSALGESSKTLGVRLHIAFRKPFFAGDAAEIALRAFRTGDELGATGAFYASDDPARKPHAHVSLRFARS